MRNNENIFIIREKIIEICKGPRDNNDNFYALYDIILIIDYMQRRGINNEDIELLINNVFSEYEKNPYKSFKKSSAYLEMKDFFYSNIKESCEDDDLDALCAKIACLFLKD